MFTIKETNWEDPDYQSLVTLLDAELAVTDGEDHDFYHQFNGSEDLLRVVLAYQESTPVACGALKHNDEDTVEIKRMFVHPDHRGRGAAYEILCYLEVLAKQLSYRRCILETGVRQLPAIRLYERSHFQRCANYGPYVGVEESICMEKVLLQETSTQRRSRP